LYHVKLKHSTATWEVRKVQDEKNFILMVTRLMVEHQDKLVQSCKDHYGCGATAFGFCLNTCTHNVANQKITEVATALLRATHTEYPNDEAVRFLFTKCLPESETYVFENDADIKRVLGHEYMRFKRLHPDEPLEVVYEPLEASVSYGVINGCEWMEIVTRTESEGEAFDEFVARLRGVENATC
jgi:hypothetical protein